MDLFTRILFLEITKTTTISIGCKRVTGQKSGKILNNEMAILYWFEVHKDKRVTMRLTTW